ncbi:MULTISPECIES: single-stranded DNA-binding protein [Flavobacterium]|jgi:single-strand DNA-binding protein|uniref:Single-stranded DNA-binding protein n=2 Tax=Flavobacterium TaxID=237 RepID=A0A1S1J3F1_9FLAO|nr:MULTISPECIES: single-stranded DNA-binding protein [Flavobacterium]MCC9020485.1 single-stranded DNA-binding protein [Flavobacterium sp. F-126]MDL2145138.1 single-stranded DNA-binding protein [Flavobacterium tructae]OHT43696.1 single-stranded DNA-binding protein [Flavobacterium tructae]OXB18918.1 single-stranded DNA-binding protein [Flavobacterium tructae]
MEITGRIVKDASVFKVKQNREAVNFSIAVNDSYKPKDSTELKKIVTYINCSYWLSAKKAQWLKKASVVELFGRISMNVYIGNDSEAHGSLTFHTSHIKILAFAKSEKETLQISAGAKANTEKEPDGLPF